MPETKVNTENRILKFLLCGGSLTVLRARELFATEDIYRIIARIRKRGYKIKDKWINENGARFKRYSI